MELRSAATTTLHDIWAGEGRSLHLPLLTLSHSERQSINPEEVRSNVKGGSKIAVCIWHDFCLKKKASMNETEERRFKFSKVIGWTFTRVLSSYKTSRIENI